MCYLQVKVLYSFGNPINKSTSMHCDSLPTGQTRAAHARSVRYSSYCFRQISKELREIRLNVSTQYGSIVCSQLTPLSSLSGVLCAQDQCESTIVQCKCLLTTILASRVQTEYCLVNVIRTNKMPTQSVPFVPSQETSTRSDVPSLFHFRHGQA